MSNCNRKTDLSYLADFIVAWKNQGPEAGFNCVGTDRPYSNTKNEINLLDFLGVLIQIKKGGGQTLVADWCDSCPTIQQTANGYLTIKGALNLDTSTSKRRPIYFYSGDVANEGNVDKYHLDVLSGKWTDNHWPNVIVKSPDIRVLDSSGSPLQSDTLDIRTIQVKDVNKNMVDSVYNNYYYVYIVDKSCSNLPLPIYQYYRDTNENPTGESSVWPLVANDGTSKDMTFPNCPECDEWDWTDNFRGNIFKGGWIRHR